MSDEPKRVIGRPFKPGEGGRPKGARNKLGEAFINAVLADFQVDGVAAIVKVRTEDPSTYFRVIASLQPKEFTGEDGAPLFEGLTVSFVKPEKK
jgi:hypothetical protein